MVPVANYSVRLKNAYNFMTFVLPDALKEEFLLWNTEWLKLYKNKRPLHLLKCIFCPNTKKKKKCEKF